MEEEKLTPKEKMGDYINFLGYESNIFGYVFIIQEYIKRNKCKEILELGVRGGFSTIGILFACKEHNAHLWSVEIATEKNKMDGWEMVIKTVRDVKENQLDKYWTFTQCNDLDYECDRQYDVIFIDTDHKYKQTLLELEKFSRFVKIGGVIFLHDTLHHEHCIDVSSAIATFMCHDFIRNHLKIRGRWKYQETGTCHGLGILERIA